MPLVIGIDSYATEIQVTGDNTWQTIELSRDDFKDAASRPLTQWATIRELRLIDKETLRIKARGEQQAHRRDFGTAWKGLDPSFRNLRWVRKL